MANVSFNQLFSTPVIVKALSQIRTPRSRICRFFGMQIGGPNVQTHNGRSVGWDISDETRKTAKGRPPSQGPASITLNPTGHVSAQVLRIHEKVHIDLDKLNQTRPVGGNFGEVDNRGQAYVTRQESILAQRVTNAREFQCSRMLRGGYAIKLDGEDHILVNLGNGTFDVDFQIPAGNKDQLDMTGAGDIITASWLTASTDVLGDLLQINAAFEELHGFPLRHTFLNSVLMTALLKNTGLQAVGGTANTIFNTFTPERDTEQGDVTDNLVIFRAIPWLTFHVYDAVLEVDGTEEKIIPDERISLLPEPGPEIAEWQEGSEIVKENLQDAGTMEFGMHAWATDVIDPAGIDLKILDNGLPGLYIPKAIAFADVTP